jgi:hypothetical protein
MSSVRDSSAYGSRRPDRVGDDTVVGDQAVADRGLSLNLELAPDSENRDCHASALALSTDREFCL